MDIAAHAMWALVLLPGEPNPEKVIFGVLPDIAVFIPDLLTSVVRREKRDFQTRKEMMAWYDRPQNRWKKQWYQWTHSLLIWLFIITPIMLWQRMNDYSISWFLTAVPLHILLDIPTHTHDSFPVTFLYPLSNYRVNGIHWSNRWAIIINYSLIIVAFYLRLFFF